MRDMVGRLNNMEKIANSSFGKFEGFELSNLQMVKGGLTTTEGATGAGSACVPDGRCRNWTSDYQRADGGYNYGGVTYTNNPC